MSKYLDDAMHAKQKLDEVSETFCLAKYLQTSLHLTTGHTNSCYHPPLHRIDPKPLADDPSALHNTEVKYQEREMMKEGRKPPGCSYCWVAEDYLSAPSDRFFRSGEPWAMDRFEEIKNIDPRDPVIPSYVEVDFSNVCNLKCSYCSPQFSSTWMKEVKQHGAYPTSTPHNDPMHFIGPREPIPQSAENPYREAFWQWWPDLYPKLKHFRMTGGEPLMDPNTFKVFDYVLENPKPDLHLNVTSNFCVEDKLFDKYIQYSKKLTQPGYLEHFMQFVSVDTFGPQAEYIRYGLDFKKLQRNVERFLTEVPERSSITFIMTASNLSLPGTKDLLQYILELRKEYTDTYQRVWFDVPILKEPLWQSMYLSPPEHVHYLDDALAFMRENLDEMHGFKDYEVLKVERNKLEKERKSVDPEALPRVMSDFYKFFGEHDRRRGTNFENTFPEFKEFWDQCKHEARKQK